MIHNTRVAGSSVGTARDVQVVAELYVALVCHVGVDVVPARLVLKLKRFWCVCTRSQRIFVSIDSLGLALQLNFFKVVSAGKYDQ